MKQFIAYLLLGALLGVIPPPVPAQHNQNSKHTAQEIEALKNRISELEKQLQTVENIEKMELQAKLAEANAKLVNSEFEKFERKLKDSNDEWLRGWSSWFLGVIGVFVAILIGVGAVFWFWLKSQASRLIVDRVEKSLNGFKKALTDLNILKTQLGVLEKEHTFSILENRIGWPLHDKHHHPPEIEALREEALLEVLSDERYDDELYSLQVRCEAAKVLAARRSPKLISSALELLNSVLDSELEIDFQSGRYLEQIANLCSFINTEDAYKGFAAFLNRLLTENLEHREVLLSVFVTPAVYSVALTGFKLNLGDSVSILKLAIPRLEIRQSHSTALNNLARYFDIFNEPEGIKEMLTSHGTNLPSEVIDKCLELLQKHDSEFVENWRAQNTTDDAESS